MAKINLNSHTWLVELVEYVEGVRYVREYWKCTTWIGAEITIKDFYRRPQTQSLTATDFQSKLNP